MFFRCTARRIQDERLNVVDHLRFACVARWLTGRELYIEMMAEEIEQSSQRELVCRDQPVFHSIGIP